MYNQVAVYICLRVGVALGIRRMRFLPRRLPSAPAAEDKRGVIGKGGESPTRNRKYRRVLGPLPTRYCGRGGPDDPLIPEVVMGSPTWEEVEPTYGRSLSPMARFAAADPQIMGVLQDIVPQGP